MTVKTSAVTVTTTATLLSLTDADKSYEGGYQQTITLYSTAAIVVGGSDVTTGNGFPVAANVAASFDLGPSDVLYARTASGTATVNVIGTGL
jgi:hypothetical protein